MRFSSLRRLLENLPCYLSSVKRLPTNLRDKVVDLMCKRGLITDANIAQVCQSYYNYVSTFPFYCVCVILIGCL